LITFLLIYQEILLYNPYKWVVRPGCSTTEIRKNHCAHTWIHILLC